MANSDKNILITPNTGSSTLSPTIVFRGANNTPVTLRTLDTGTISFEGTAGQLFSISDGLSGSIFSVNDISGIPSIEVLDTGLIKLNQYSGSTAFGSSAAIQNSFSVNAKVSISTVFPATPGLIIKAVSSQTANLQEWQNSVGGVDTAVTSTGRLSVRTTLADAGLNVGTPSAATVGAIIRGVTSQTADLQQWQNSSGTVLAYIEAGGHFGVGNLFSSFGGSSTKLGYVTVSGSLPAIIPLVVKGAASQTANLQQWQNSAGTALVTISSTGFINTSSGIGTNTTSYMNGISDASATKMSLSFNSTSYGLLLTNIQAAGVGFIVKGAASQTANLQEWQDNSGSVYAKVDNSGNIYSRNNFQSLASDIYLIDSTGTAFRSVRAAGWVDSVSTRFFQVGTSGDNVAITTLNGVNAARLQFNSVFTTITSFGYSNTPSPDSTLSVINGSTISHKVLTVKGISGQTANLQEWQNSSGSVLLSVSSDGSLNKTGTLNIGPILSFADPGVGNETKFVFNKTNDSAYLTVKERSSDQTFYEFGMWDNALDGGDYFQWSMGQWSGGTGQGWMPIQLGYNTSPNGSKTQTLRFTGEQSVFWSPILTGTNTPYYTTTVNHSSNVDYEIFKYYPDTSATRTIPRTNASGGATLNIDLSGYTYSSRMGYKITVNSGGTTFDYSTYGGDNSSGTAIAITVGSWQTLSNGTKIKINGTPAASDDWQFLAFPTPRVSFGGSAEATALVTIKPSASDKGLVVKGAASQTANLQEWQNSSGTVLLRVNNVGQIQAPQPASVGLVVKAATTLTATVTNAVGNGTTVTYTAANTFTAGQTVSITGVSPVAYNLSSVTIATATTTTFTVTNAATGTYVSGGTATVIQSSNLQQWQDSAGNTTTRVLNDGSIVWGTASSVLQNSSGRLVVNPGTAASVGVTVKGFTSQTADLQQWQNSAGTVLANIDSVGNIGLGAGKILSFANSIGAKINLYGGNYTLGIDDYTTVITADNNASNGRVGIRPHNATYSTSYVSPIELFVNGQIKQNLTVASAVGLIVKGAASQTADLQQWQNSSNTVLSKIDAYGRLGIATSILANSSGGYSQASIANFNTTDTNLIIKGYAAQTATLQEWQNSAGTVLVRVTNSGVIGTSVGVYSPIYQGNNGVGGAITFANATAITITPQSASVQSLIVKGAASQSANLQEWQNSAGTVMASISASGSISQGSSTNYTLLDSAYGQVSIRAGGNLSGSLTVGTGAASITAIIVKGVDSQTANFQEWQNNSGTVLASINNTGRVNASTIGTLNNWVFSKEESSGGQIRLKKSTAAPTEFRASDFGQIYLRDGTNAGTLKLVIVAGASGAETTILDNIPQS